MKLLFLLLSQAQHSQHSPQNGETRKCASAALKLINYSLYNFLHLLLTLFIYIQVILGIFFDDLFCLDSLKWQPWVKNGNLACLFAGTSFNGFISFLPCGLVTSQTLLAAAFVRYILSLQRRTAAAAVMRFGWTVSRAFQRPSWCIHLTSLPRYWGSRRRWGQRTATHPRSACQESSILIKPFLHNSTHSINTRLPLTTSTNTFL